MAREILGESVCAFIDKYVDSFLAWDVIVLFSHNPGLRDGAEEIAKFLGRKPEDLEEALEGLVKKGLIESACSEKSEVYFYNPSHQLARQVAEFVKVLGSREKRLAVLAKLLKKQR